MHIYIYWQFYLYLYIFVYTQIIYSYTTHFPARAKQNANLLIMLICGMFEVILELQNTIYFLWISFTRMFPSGPKPLEELFLWVRPLKHFERLQGTWNEHFKLIHQR